MFSDSNERVKKRRPDHGKSDKVVEGDEQVERARGDVEAQHNNGAAPDVTAPADSAVWQFCDRVAGILLANARSITFVMAMINSIIQILIYGFSLSTIINNYSPELHHNNYPQYLMHHLGYFNYMVFHCLFTGVTSWAALHLTLRILRAGFNFVMMQLTSSHAPGWMRTLARGGEQYHIEFYVSVFFLAVIEIILLALYVLECRLLVDMSVHLIDLDLVEILGIKQVLQRQRELGAGIDPDHWPYIKLVVVLLFVGQATCFLLARWMVRRLSRQQLRKLFLYINIIILVTGVIVTFQTVVIYEDVEHYRGQLPFNYIDPNPVDRLIPVIPRTNTDFPPQPGAAYPRLTEAQVHATVKKKKNVILYAVESMRYDDATHTRSPHLMKFVEENKCISPKIHAASGHVSEMAQFSLLYGIHAYHYHSFAVGHVPSYAIKTLKENGYVTGGVTASAAWNYPNRNLYNNLDEYDATDLNYEFLEKTQEFVNRRKADQKPFFLFLVVHKRPVPNPPPPGYYDRDPQGDTREYSNRIIREKDADRHKVIEMLREANLLDDSIILITADHGNMEGEHGEKGHGQRESSWWNEKILSPSFICMPGDASIDMYEPYPALASHVDYVPTIMDYLGLEPAIDPRAYSNGGSLLIKKGEHDWTKDRSVFFSARYFPEKNKINAVANTEYKFWFRVVAFDRRTREMEIVPIKVTNWKDEALCLPVELREEWSRLRQTINIGQQPQEGKCKMTIFHPLVENFREEFFNFLQIDQKAYE